MTGAASPSAAYAAGIARGDWQDDPAQHHALQALDRIHTALLQASPRKGWLGTLFGDGEAPVVKGLYLWGGVGRGKTFLIDLFFDSLSFDGLSFNDLSIDGLSFDGAPITRKRRTHFHRFMREVHEQLRAHSGERDPLAAIAAQWGRQWRVLVLDEFFVSDIGDAMLLGRLLEKLFAEGVVLVTSSNTPPSALYKDGLQRARFEPAIALIEQHCAVVHLDSPTDYRLRALTRSPVYRAPLDAQSDAWLRSRWDDLTRGTPHEDGPLQIDGRAIAVRGLAEGHAWFDFAALCEGPRGSNDYIEIAQEFHTVLLGDIPAMGAQQDDAARRFVTLIDELYDRHVNFVCTADAAPPALYGGQRLHGAFERTRSRLIEMQSAEYLALEHRG